MGRLHQIGKIIIRVYANDHLPAHFHVIGPQDEALVEIATQTVWAGELPRAHRRQVVAWIAANINVIRAEWNRINPASLCRIEAMRPKKLPRILRVAATAPATLYVIWVDGRPADTIDLRGWIATGGDVLAALGDKNTFSAAYAAAYGSAVAWGNDEGDLMIDAVHLRALADEQGPFDAAKWQASVELSNQEAAELLGLSLSTWNSYKAGSKDKVPVPVAIACRAAQRDPIILQAHYRPRKAGRPRKAATAAG